MELDFKPQIAQISQIKNRKSEKVVSSVCLL
jgi:hypothetical protein